MPSPTYPIMKSFSLKKSSIALTQSFKHKHLKRTLDEFGVNVKTIYTQHLFTSTDLALIKRIALALTSDLTSQLWKGLEHPFLHSGLMALY